MLIGAENRELLFLLKQIPAIAAAPLADQLIPLQPFSQQGKPPAYVD